jgi:hypothetical protein
MLLQFSNQLTFPDDNPRLRAAEQFVARDTVKPAPIS